MKGKISEIFASFQGEGIYLGAKQLFVRFFDCNLSCKFCDTKLKNYKEIEAVELFKEIKGYHEIFHSIAFTGGEPLLQKDFLKEILKLTHQAGMKNYLETNGILVEALREVIKDLDIIAMDIKLPSSTGMKDYLKEHREFLEIGREKDIFVKMVICNSTQAVEVEEALKLVASLNRDIPVVLQPNFFELGTQLMQKSDDFQRIARNYLSSCRVIPQMHKLNNVK